MPLVTISETKQYRPVNDQQSTMNTKPSLGDIEIIEFPATRIAVLEHRGAPQTLMASVSTFIEWRRLHGPSPKTSMTYNILYDDPSAVAPEDYCFDICASIKVDVAANDFAVIEKIIPPGRCAVLRHIGSEAQLGAKIEYLYGNWLGQSSENLRDFPCFLERFTSYPDVPEHKMIIDIYLPIE